MLHWLGRRQNDDITEYMHGVPRPADALDSHEDRIEEREEENDGSPETAGKERVPREHLPRYAFVLFGIAGIAVLVYFAAALFEGFANAYTGTVGAALRAALAHLTSWIPFSLAEVAIFCIPVIVVGIVVYAYRYRCDTLLEMKVYLGTLLSIFSIFLSLFAFVFGTAYHTTTLDKRLGLAVTEVDAEALYETAMLLAESTNAAAANVSFGEDGFSRMPYGHDEMNSELLEAYAPVCEQYPFIQRLDSRVKPVAASKLLSYTHITGVYTYFTGEANLNVHFPDYSLPYTAAHELAHQRGIARENEANFVAFLVTTASNDPYIRYCGYINMFEYVASALYRADAALYREVLLALDKRVLGELQAYSAFFDTYRDAAAGNVSSAVNDAYLKMHGNTAGTASYGLVVDLAVAYYKEK